MPRKSRLGPLLIHYKRKSLLQGGGFDPKTLDVPGLGRGNIMAYIQRHFRIPLVQQQQFIGVKAVLHSGLQQLVSSLLVHRNQQIPGIEMPQKYPPSIAV